MIYVVNNDNKERFRDQLIGMYKDRKRVFVDMLKWDIPIVDGLEMDQFDVDHTQYLIITDPHSDKHVASVRLLPTASDHLLGNIFPELCHGDVPTGEDIWEISRFLLSPDLSARERIPLRNQLVTGLVELGLVYGLKGYTCMAGTSWLAQILKMGWKSNALGEPQEIEGDMTGALYLHVIPETLRQFRDQWNISAPLIKIVPEQIAA